MDADGARSLPAAKLRGCFDRSEPGGGGAPSDSMMLSESALKEVLWESSKRWVGKKTGRWRASL
jgi:hypothetical protein